VYEKGEYRLTRSSENGPLVTKVNFTLLAAQCFPGFTLQSTSIPFKHVAIRNVLYRGRGGEGITFFIGLHPSVRAAEDAILDMLNIQVNISMIENTTSPVGDNSWHDTRTKSPEDPNVIAFIRKNAVVFFLHAGEKIEDVNLLPIANAIDATLVNGASYITITDTLNPPIVHSLELSKNAVGEKERVEIIIHASDPEGNPFYYCSNAIDPFGVKGKNILPYFPSQGYFPDEPFYGPHTIKAWVVNDNCLFSNIVETPIIFSTLRGEQ